MTLIPEATCPICHKGKMVTTFEKAFLGKKEFCICSNSDCLATFSKSRTLDNWKLSSCKLQTDYLNKETKGSSWHTLFWDRVISNPLAINVKEAPKLDKPPKVVELNELESNSDGFKSVAVSPLGKFFIVATKNYVYLFNSQNSMIRKMRLEGQVQPEHFIISDTGTFLYQYLIGRSIVVQAFHYDEKGTSLLPSSKLFWLRGNNALSFDSLSGGILSSEWVERAFSPNMDLAAYSSSANKSVAFLGFISSKRKNPGILLDSHTNRLRFSQNGCILLAWKNNGIMPSKRIYAVELETSNKLWHGAIDTLVEVKSTESKVLATDQFSKIFIFSITGLLESVLALPTKVDCFSASQDARVIFSSNNENVAEILAFTPDGKVLWKHKTIESVLDIEATYSGNKVVGVTRSRIFIFDDTV